MRLNITIDFKALDNRSAKGAFRMARLFHFRFYIFEQIVIEEINDRDPQAVAQLLQRGEVHGEEGVHLPEGDEVAHLPVEADGIDLLKRAGIEIEQAQ